MRASLPTAAAAAAAAAAMPSAATAAASKGDARGVVGLCDAPGAIGVVHQDPQPRA